MALGGIADVTLPTQRIMTPPSPVRLAQANSNLSDADQAALDDLLLEGQDRIDARDYAGAISAYEQATRIDPRNPRLYSG
ncbi:MAG: hypothetical protein O3A14_08545, partial [Cyanobacteria bacterium]|nr:hypothetical protein [Cyanobacteriota bacterium]